MVFTAFYLSLVERKSFYIYWTVFYNRGNLMITKWHRIMITYFKGRISNTKHIFVNINIVLVHLLKENCLIEVSLVDKETDYKSIHVL